MALKLDNNLIDELGLGSLPEQEKQLLLRQIYEKLEMNVGVRLADQMTNEQLDEFEKFVDANDDKGAFQWLETNFPNYKDVVNDEFEKLKTEIKQYAPQMLAAAQHNAAQAANAAVPQPQQAAPGQMPQQTQPQYQQPPVNPYAQPYGGQPAQAPVPGYGQAPQPAFGQTPQPGYPAGPQPGQYDQPYPSQQPQQYQQPFPPQPGSGQYPPQQPPFTPGQ